MATIYTLQVNKYIRLAITYTEKSLAGSMILLLQMWGHSMVACNDEQIKHWKCNSGIINEMIYFKEDSTVLIIFVVNPRKVYIGSMTSQ